MFKECIVCQAPASKGCSRCKAPYIRYCGKECQAKHWQGGHKTECKPCENNQGNKWVIPKDAECNICLERDDLLIPLGCACRGKSAYGHLACRAKAAMSRGIQEWDAWHTCDTCKQDFTGAMQLGLARRWIQHTRCLKRGDENRLAAETNLGNALIASGRHSVLDHGYLTTVALRPHAVRRHCCP